VFAVRLDDTNFTRWTRAVFRNASPTVDHKEKPSAAGNATVLLTAINHPLFKSEELREAAQRQYPEIGMLFRAVRELGRPPSHFFAQ
jgi:hypothetical protein